MQTHQRAINREARLAVSPRTQPAESPSAAIEHWSRSRIARRMVPMQARKREEAFHEPVSLLSTLQGARPREHAKAWTTNAARFMAGEQVQLAQVALQEPIEFSKRGRLGRFASAKSKTASTSGDHSRHRPTAKAARMAAVRSMGREENVSAAAQRLCSVRAAGASRTRMPWRRFALVFLCAVGFWAVAADAGAAEPARVPGVVVDHRFAESGLYIGSPSIAILPSSDYVASHDLFGPRSGESRTLVFGSTDRGQTWQQRAGIDGQFWSTLFVHQGALYLIGTAGRTSTSSFGVPRMVAAPGRHPRISRPGSFWRTVNTTALQCQ
jgi:hypothetical protein